MSHILRCQIYLNYRKPPYVHSQVSSQESLRAMFEQINQKLVTFKFGQAQTSIFLKLSSNSFILSSMLLICSSVHKYVFASNIDSIIPPSYLLQKGTMSTEIILSPSINLALIINWKLTSTTLKYSIRIFLYQKQSAGMPTKTNQHAKRSISKPMFSKSLQCLQLPGFHIQKWVRVQPRQLHSSHFRV